MPPSASLSALGEGTPRRLACPGRAFLPGWALVPLGTLFFDLPLPFPSLPFHSPPPWGTGRWVDVGPFPGGTLTFLQYSLCPCIQHVPPALSVFFSALVKRDARFCNHTTPTGQANGRHLLDFLPLPFPTVTATAAAAWIRSLVSRTLRSHKDGNGRRKEVRFTA